MRKKLIRLALNMCREGDTETLEDTLLCAGYPTGCWCFKFGVLWLRDGTEWRFEA